MTPYQLKSLGTMAALSAFVLLLLQLRLGLPLFLVLSYVCLALGLNQKLVKIAPRPTTQHPVLTKVLALGATLIGLALAFFLLYKLGASLTVSLKDQIPKIIENAQASWSSLSARWAVGSVSASPSALDSSLAITKVKSLAKSHATELLSITGMGLRGFSMGALALIIGVSVANSKLNAKTPQRELSKILNVNARLFKETFSQFLTVQLMVAVWNTTCLGIVLYWILPLCSIDLPLRSALVGLTFFLSFVPALGNVISNAMVTLVAVGHSLWLAVAAVVYLVLAHKQEYWISAHFLGKTQKVSVAEVLVSVLIGESLFGVFGMILIPVLYLYIKKCLVRLNLID